MQGILIFPGINKLWSKGGLGHWRPTLAGTGRQQLGVWVFIEVFMINRSLLHRAGSTYEKKFKSDFREEIRLEKLKHYCASEESSQKYLGVNLCRMPDLTIAGWESEVRQMICSASRNRYDAVR